MAEQTRFPSGLNEEDPFFVTSLMRFSLRQLLWIGAGFGGVFIVANLIGGIIGIGWIGWVLAFPLLFVAFAFAFYKKEGRHLELWVADNISFALSEREYTLVNPDTRPDRGRVVDADFEEEMLRGW